MIYPFVDNPQGNPQKFKHYEIYKYYKEGGRYNKEMKKVHNMGGYSSQTDSLIYNGIVKLMGWIFDYRNIFNKYVIKHKDYGWFECYGPSKMFIRDYFGNNNILKIIKID